MEGARLRPRLARYLAGVAFVCSTLALAGTPSLEQERARFEAADAQLNAVYADAARELPAGAFEELRLDQRRWLERRDPYAEDVAHLEAGAAGLTDPEDEPWFWIARTERTLARSEVLGGWLSYYRGLPAEAGWSGAWADGDGGWLLMLDDGSAHLAFDLFVVRGPTHHLGQLEGVAERIGRSARFATASVWDEAPTWLTFVAEGPRVRLWAENARWFHGMRAYFDGDYVRVRALTEEERGQLESLLAQAFEDDGER